MMNENKNVILIAEKIYKNYPMGKSSEVHVLKGIDIRLNQGEITAVIGPSGVGKSTLLHLLGTLDRPTEGSVFIQSKNVFTLSDTALATFRNKTIGFIFQFHHLLPDFTALENVAMPGLIGREDPKEVFQKAGSLLDEVGLKDRRQHKPRELSGGEQQRVAFARSLINDPSIILADEPSGNLDLVNSQTLHDLMWDLVRRKNKTFVVVTHNIDLADRADQVIELLDGKVK